jgi:catechol 2,3-dioxygenase-like lactoylglutathione lyase family enzyme
VEVFGPCLLVKDVPASARFYIEHFGFQPRVELDWFTTSATRTAPTSSPSSAPTMRRSPRAAGAAAPRR